MQRKRSGWMAVLAIVALALAACSSGKPAADSPVADAASQGPRSGARTLDIPAPRSPTPAETRAGQPGKLSWTVPATWIEEQPANSMRFAQYRVPGAAGDGECVVFYFGPGQGGDPISNANRWAGQFSQPDGRPTAEVMQIVELETTRVAVHLIEITGTYDGGMSSIEELPAAMLLGGIAQGSDAPWFFKFIGPEETVRAERAAFIAMMESAKIDG